MKTISAPPGAAMFRLSLMIIIVAILVLIFFRYVDDSQVELERQSVLQTKRIIDSSLAVAFAGYAVKGELDRLNELDGGNPFAILQQFDLLPSAYQGEVDGAPGVGAEPGWYYLRQRGQVVYKSRFNGGDEYFTLQLVYEDVDRNESFEADRDRFIRLQFVRSGTP